MMEKAPEFQKLSLPYLLAVNNGGRYRLLEHFSRSVWWAGFVMIQMEIGRSGTRIQSLHFFIDANDLRICGLSRERSREFFIPLKREGNVIYFSARNWALLIPEVARFEEEIIPWRGCKGPHAEFVFAALSTFEKKYIIDVSKSVRSTAEKAKNNYKTRFRHDKYLE